MKSVNIFIAIIVALFYNIFTLHLNPIPYGLIAALLIAVIVTGLIMIFKKDRSNWSSVFMWTTIILSVLAAIGNNPN
tara:strand:+ start:896 stop:1126 length:231 start_codon:yes stop_codon:yes gene_type:complete